MWRSLLVIALLCAILGAVALAALAGARRTESAYGRYLTSINSSDVYVNVPSPDTTLDARVAALPGIASSAAWLGLNANPVVNGRVDDSFVTNGFAGSVSGELFVQDRMTVVAGHLPPLDSSNQICLTAGIARLFGVHVGGHVTYQFENSLSFIQVPTGLVTYRVAAIVELPPVLDDQFDQSQSAIIPPAATAAARAQRSSGLLVGRGAAARRQRRGRPVRALGVPPRERSGQWVHLCDPPVGPCASAGPRGDSPPGLRDCSVRRLRTAGPFCPGGPSALSAAGGPDPASRRAADNGFAKARRGDGLWTRGRGDGRSGGPVRDRVRGRAVAARTSRASPRDRSRGGASSSTRPSWSAAER